MRDEEREMNGVDFCFPNFLPKANRFSTTGIKM